MSVKMKFSIKGFNFRMKMLCMSMEDRQHLHNSLNFIRKYVIGQLTFNFKMI